MAGGIVIIIAVSVVMWVEDGWDDFFQKFSSELMSLIDITSAEKGVMGVVVGLMERDLPGGSWVEVDVSPLPPSYVPTPLYIFNCISLQL